jgi:hypothetical protein
MVVCTYPIAAFASAHSAVSIMRAKQRRECSHFEPAAYHLARPRIDDAAAVLIVPRLLPTLYGQIHGTVTLRQSRHATIEQSV